MLSVIQKITEQNTGGIDLEHVNKSIHIYKSEHDKTKYYFKKCMKQINIANKCTFIQLPLYEFQYFTFYFNYLQITNNIFWDSTIFKYKNFLSTPKSEHQMVHIDDCIRQALITSTQPYTVISNNINKFGNYHAEVQRYNTKFIKNIDYITDLPKNKMQRWINISHDLLLNYLNQHVFNKPFTRENKEFYKGVYRSLILHKDLQDLLTEKIKMSKLFS